MKLKVFSNQNENENATAWAFDHVITTGGGCTAQGPCYYREICPTLKSGGPHAVVKVKDETNNP